MSHRCWGCLSCDRAEIIIIIVEEGMNQSISSCYFSEKLLAVSHKNYVSNVAPVTEIKMGVTKEVIREGDGANFPTKGTKLAMHYKGTLASNGEAFDSSYDRGRPFEFKIGKGEVIQGWDEGGTFMV